MIHNSIDWSKQIYKNRNGNQLIQQHQRSQQQKNTEIPKTEFMLSLRNEISLQRYHLGFIVGFAFLCAALSVCVCRGVDVAVVVGARVLMQWYQF